MNSLSSHRVVDQLAAQLSERRRTTIGRRAAYLALTGAILGDEHPLFMAADSERQPTAIGAQSSLAA
jgi:hypothetical protein